MTVNLFSWIQESLEESLFSALCPNEVSQKMALRLQDVFKCYTQIEPATRAMFDKQMQPVFEKHEKSLLKIWPKIPAELQQIIWPLLRLELKSQLSNQLPTGGQP